jgi:hypothetical protein
LPSYVLRSPVPVFRRYSFSVLTASRTQDALRTRIPKVSKPESEVGRKVRPLGG